MSHTNTIRTRNAGLSLVEMMVAVLISLFLIAGVITLFAATQRAYTDSERFSRTQEGARFAMVTLASDLRLAGFFAGLNAASIHAGDDSLGAVGGDCANEAAAYDHSVALAATTSDGGGSAYGCITDAVPGTQALVVKHVRPTPLAGNESNERTYLIANRTAGWLYDGADSRPSDEIPDGQVWEYLAHVYYIRNNGGAPMLSRMVLRMVGGSMTMVPEDLVPGVEQMVFEFGTDGNGDGVLERFFSTANGPNWDRVGAVRVHLLLRDEQEDRSYTDTKSYDLGGIIFRPGGRFHRTVLSSTISLRNRLFAIREGIR